MAKQLLIRTPQTTDGKTLQYDDAGHPVFKESYAEPTAKKHFESLNGHLLSHLRHRLEIVDVEFDSYGQPLKPKQAKAATDDDEDLVGGMAAKSKPGPKPKEK